MSVDNFIIIIMWRLLFLISLIVIIKVEGKLKINSPPHCTHVSKDTDYVSRFKFDYPPMYIPAGQREAYQKMFCLNPAAVNKAVTVVCDWSAPPQVQFTLGDDYMHVVRQDPSQRFLGDATITTYQLCSHNLTNEEYLNNANIVIIDLELNNV